MNAIVVTGATGNVGRPLVQALVEAGEKVIAVSRNAAIRERRADLTKPESLEPLLDGADALFLLTSAEVHANGDLEPVVKLARAADVRRVVLLSSQGVGSKRHSSRLEDAVRDSGLEWTVLRGSGFFTNALQWAASVREQRVLSAPFGDVALPIVDPVDIAAVATVALRENGHGGKVYTLTGPERLSPRQQAAAIGAAIGAQVRFVELTRADAKTAMLPFMPESVADASLDILRTPTAYERQISPDVERITGRPARTFAEWAATNADAFR
jgi:uncharacterized protein YbjT (DUF2867 family)